MSSFDDERKYLSVEDLKRLEEKKLLEKDDEENLQIDATDFLAIFIAALQTIFLPVIIAIVSLVIIWLLFRILLLAIG
ncbi:MAG: hypothetical protein ACFFCZ_25480 [Promethearchaeota archaeon]